MLNIVMFSSFPFTVCKVLTSQVGRRRTQGFVFGHYIPQSHHKNAWHLEDGYAWQLKYFMLPCAKLLIMNVQQGWSWYIFDFNNTWKHQLLYCKYTSLNTLVITRFEPYNMREIRYWSPVMHCYFKNLWELLSLRTEPTQQTLALKAYDQEH